MTTTITITASTSGMETLFRPWSKQRSSMRRLCCTVLDNILFTTYDLLYAIDYIL